MIEINLLPEQMRRAEGTPLPRLLTICVGVALALLLIFVNAKYYMRTKKAVERKDTLIRDVADLQVQEQELTRIEGEIAAIGARIHAAEELFRNRIVYAKLLADLKRAINQLGFERMNEAREYLWLHTLSIEQSRSAGPYGATDGPKQFLKLEGYASAAGNNTRRASQMVNDLMYGLLTYTPSKTPEEEARERREEELEGRIAELQAKDPEALTEDERRELEAAEAFEQHLKSHRSGLIARKPLYEAYFTDQGRDLSVEWEDSLSTGGQNTLPNLPNAAMGFDIRLGFRPRQQAEEAPKTF